MATYSKLSINRQLLLFFTCTYVTSWTLFSIGNLLELTPVIMLGVWVPSLIALIITYFAYGKIGLKEFFGRFRRYRIKWYWWMTLLLLPAFIHFTGRSLWQIYFNGVIDPFYRDPQYWLGAIIPSFLIAGFGEELGWRGFALPRLQRIFSPLPATMILALVHLFWHLPTYWLGQGMHNVPLIFVLCFLFPWSIIFSWIYNRSGGSLVFAVSFHAISNASLSIVRFMPLDSEVPITPELISQTSLPISLAGPYLAVCAVYLAVALLVIKYGKFNSVNTDIP